MNASVPIPADLPVRVEIRRGAHLISLERTECRVFPGFGTIFLVRDNGRLLGSADSPAAARLLFSQILGATEVQS